MDWLAILSGLSGPPVRGVIHVGANDGAEFPIYEAHGVRRQVWIEPQPEPFARLLERLPVRPGMQAFQVACGERNGTARMTLLAGNREMSSSLLKPKKHLDYYPQFPAVGEIEVPIVRLDDLIDERDYNLLVLDVQGYELRCLEGAPRTVRGMDYVLTEVNAEELYESCCLVGDLDRWLAGAGLHRVRTEWCAEAHCSWGDALYVRT